jgi:hypothetical protein
VRFGNIGYDGTWQVTVRPATNTRLVARLQSGAGWIYTPTRAVQMRVGISLRISARQADGRRTFAGTALPAFSGRLVSLYRITNAGNTLVAQMRTSSTGSYTWIGRIVSGTATYQTRVAATDRNAAGQSSLVRPV